MRPLLLLLFFISFPATANAPDFSEFPKWQAMLDRAEIDEEATLRRIHARLVKRYKYIEEENDYWKSPAEFRHDGGGDCEDFAIALYFEAISAGIKENGLFITVGWLSDLQQVHAALRYGDWYFDNRAAKPFSSNIYRRVFTPAYEINRLGWQDFRTE